ncbi:hypothetical protein LCGC14_2582890 [marine sediment metagenome]|uniref:Uncharacterized protein n=1 Tax=marine sediment metagenome TaxID=412755 RepID=A0A0F9D6Q4_9ZZZZ
MKKTRLRILAGEEGFEPSLRDSESRVLPLDYSPKTDATELKSTPLPVFSGTIRPLFLSQKAARIRQLLQSQLPSFQHSLDILCNQRYNSSAQKCQFLIYQPAKHGLAGILFAFSARAGLYNSVTDNANEPPSLTAPLTLPESVVEVMP